MHGVRIVENRGGERTAELDIDPRPAPLRVRIRESRLTLADPATDEAVALYCLECGAARARVRAWRRVARPAIAGCEQPDGNGGGDAYDRDAPGECHGGCLVHPFPPCRGFRGAPRQSRQSIRLRLSAKRARETS